MDANQSVIQSSHIDGVLVVEITSSHLRTPEASYAVRDALVEVVTSEKADNLVLDLGKVTFIGSVGLLGFLAVRRMESTQEIVVCNLSSTLKTMFLKCRLISEQEGREAPFGYADTTAEAVAQINEGG